MKIISIALPIGEALIPSIEFLGKIGITCDLITSDTRRRIYLDNKHKYKLLLLDPFDIPDYVSRGYADLGFVTKDILLEKNTQVSELLELNFGKGRLILAGLNDVKIDTGLSYSLIATNYPNITFNYFSQKNIPVEILKLHPPLTLALETKIADMILTFFDDNFHNEDIFEIAELAKIPNLLIANPISLKTFFHQINFLFYQMKEYLEPSETEGLSSE